MDTTILNKVYEYFHNNESTKQYLQIISTALERQKDFQPTINKYCYGTVAKKKKTYFDYYTETHHIIPESIDITYAKYKPNWVVLTGEEHFTCHKLLVDMCIEKDHYYSMCGAYRYMCVDNRGWTVTAEEYAIAKKLYVEAMSLKKTGIPTCKGESIECYIIVEGKEIILDKFISSCEAGDKTNGSTSAIRSVVIGDRSSSGNYNLLTKQYNERRFGGSSMLPNKKYPDTYRLFWRKENSKSTVVIIPKELIECYVIVEGKEIVLDKFKSIQYAEEVTNGNQASIGQASIGKTNYSGTYNIETKQYNENKFGPSKTLPNNNYPSTYRCQWRKENSKSTVVIIPKELIECYVIVDNEEIILDKFKLLQEAVYKTNGSISNIGKASNGNRNYSGTYNIETKQYNERRFSGNSKLPNNNYPTTYKCYWRKIKE